MAGKGQKTAENRPFKKAALDVQFCDFSTLISTLAQQTEQNSNEIN
jgi:hypothetical protein